MERFIPQVQSAIRQFETVLLPKLAIVSIDPQDAQKLKQHLGELRRIEQEAAQPPVFSIRFLGDTQNGKSTLINVLLGSKVLPEGHVGSCSATIVRCRYRKQEEVTVEFRYVTEEEFKRDLDEKCRLAEEALTEEESEAKRREVVCGSLGRFIRLLGIQVEAVPDNADLIARCRRGTQTFEGRELLGTRKKMTVHTDTEAKIQENLSAKGKLAAIVDECVIEGSFNDWHPAMELVDLPGTNAFNSLDDQVNARLQQKVAGLAIVTKETQLHSTVMEWFKESSILPEIAGASERNQVRVFVLKTFVDQLNLDEEDERSYWDQTRTYCEEITEHLKKQVMELVYQRYSSSNEIEVLKSFVEHLPVHHLSPKIYRALAGDGSHKAKPDGPAKRTRLAVEFDRFDQNPKNTGIPGLREDLYNQTESYIGTHFWNKLQLDFRTEVGQVAHFFHGQRVGIEQRLAHKGAFIHEVNEGLRETLLRCVGSHLEASETKFANLKRRFQMQIGVLLRQVTSDFASKTRRKLHDWQQLHWASLRCAGRKYGQHITARGNEIDFNGNLADFCVEALNSTWIWHRSDLRKQLLDDLRLGFIPELQTTVARAMGQEPERVALIDSTYKEIVEMAKQNLDLTLAKYDAEAEQFDALRPVLMVAIRSFLQPTYTRIAAEIGTGSAARMRNCLSEGVLGSIGNIDQMVSDAVRRNWEGLTAAVERNVLAFFEDLRRGFQEQADRLERLAKDPSQGDAERVHEMVALEIEVEGWIRKEAA